MTLRSTLLDASRFSAGSSWPVRRWCTPHHHFAAPLLLRCEKKTKVVTRGVHRIQGLVNPQLVR